MKIMDLNYQTTILVFVTIVHIASLFGSVLCAISTGNYNSDFHVTWSPSHVITSRNGRSRSIKLDKESGAGFASNQKFLFGRIDMQIKLIPGHPQGTVVAYYLASDEGSKRDEIDFEFLGTVPGQPYTLQTNIYADGKDGREQRIHLWFDPSKQFHTYSVLWNTHQIVFMVDKVPIRTYRNYRNKGIGYPRKPMNIITSIWNGDQWATRGGRAKIDWSKGPFVATFGSYKIDGCLSNGNPGSCSGKDKWWNRDQFGSLTREQKKWFTWVRKNHMFYDYCSDKTRFHNNLPKECSLPKY